MMVASGRGAPVGHWRYRALEAIRSIDTVVFDKTGTSPPWASCRHRGDRCRRVVSDDVLAPAVAVESD